MSILLWWGKSGAAPPPTQPFREPLSIWGLGLKPPRPKYELENELAIISAILHYYYS